VVARHDQAVAERLAGLAEIDVAEVLRQGEDRVAVLSLLRASAVWAPSADRVAPVTTPPAIAPLRLKKPRRSGSAATFAFFMLEFSQGVVGCPGTGTATLAAPHEDFVAVV
jgi:hypothetical protein